jgi:hypothetical protein
MKRFVDLRHVPWIGRFAWYDTVRDKFETHDGEMTWHCWAEFELVYVGTELDRYRGLTPEWAFDCTKEEDG